MTDFLNWLGSFIGATIRMATPLMFVAIGSCVTQQGGILNMAGEAMMLASSLFGIVFIGITGKIWVGILCGALVSVLVTLFICFAAFVMKVDMYLMSISMNMALLGGVIFGMWLIYGVKSHTAPFVIFDPVANVRIPLIDKIPFIGEILSGHNIFTWIAVFFGLFTQFLLFKTKFGLRVRAVGQNPQAAESVGINPRKIYTLAFAYAASYPALVVCISQWDIRTSSLRTSQLTVDLSVLPQQQLQTQSLDSQSSCPSSSVLPMQSQTLSRFTSWSSSSSQPCRTSSRQSSSWFCLTGDIQRLSVS